MKMPNEILNTILANIKRAGGTVLSGAAKVVAPVATASLVYQGLKQVPGIGTVIKGFEKVEDFIMNKALGSIPIVGWFARTSQQISNAIRGIRSEDNDIAWYGGDQNLPANDKRAMGYPYYPGIFNYPTLGMVPKFHSILMEPMEFSKSPRFSNNSLSVFMAMRDNLRSNLTYSLNQLRVFILNNISLYMLAKLFERKFGFMKYTDAQFPQWRDAWNRITTDLKSYQIQPISADSDLDYNSAAFAEALDVYSLLTDSVYLSIIPENMKKWIDHYCGSVFIIDDDVENWKYVRVDFNFIYWYTLSDDEIVVQKIPLTGFDIRQFNSLAQAWFDNNLNGIIRADLTKQPTLTNKIVPVSFATGWLTKYENYTPTPTKDKTFEQLIVNAYTDKSCIGADGSIRLDIFQDGAGDKLTALLPLGVLVEDQIQYKDVYRSMPLKVLSYSAIIPASSDLPIVIPKQLRQDVAQGDATFTVPFAITVNTTIHEDAYIGVTTMSESTEDNTVYYPSAVYPDSVPNTIRSYVSFNSTEEDLSCYKRFGHSLGEEYLYIPLYLKSDGYLIALESVKSVFQLGALTNFSLLDECEFVYIEPAKLIAESIDVSHPFTCPKNWRSGTLSMSVIIHSDNPEKFKLTIPPLNHTYSGGYILTLHWPALSLEASETYDDPVTYNWIVQVPLANSDMTYHYVSANVAVSEIQVTENAGFVGLADYMFSACGYCIPMRPVTQTHVMIDAGAVETFSIRNDYILKEDYIPFTIKVSDLPAIYDKMISGLTKFTDKDYKTES